eukprot:TRINITY_DN3812_c0_g1_i1.p1 TRINITY_DN3812_c0_g1~~TRINITY_DN3812_c0_g1_i1.p1  ORF type:complete len:160 (+),score=24.81 TRINITY_DN3812_c0_g1_i1:63-542(+)
MAVRCILFALVLSVASAATCVDEVEMGPTMSSTNCDKDSDLEWGGWWKLTDTSRLDDEKHVCLKTRWVRLDNGKCQRKYRKRCDVNKCVGADWWEELVQDNTEEQESNFLRQKKSFGFVAAGALVVGVGIGVAVSHYRQKKNTVTSDQTELLDELAVLE